MPTLIALFVGTFASEDLACITAGLLVQRGDVEPVSATVACALGIFVGDVGLWGIGRLFGGLVLAWPRVARRLEHGGVARLHNWLDRHAAGVLVGSRFLPGTRLPLYLIAGFVKVPAMTFSFWALVGSALWTPTLVLLTAALGDVFVSHIAPIVGLTWPARI